MVRWPRGQGRKPPLAWSRGNPSGTDRSWCHGGDRVTGRKCPRQRGENGPQLSALLQAPHVPLLATQGLGDGPSLWTSCRNREEQGRAGSGREQADQLPARDLRQGCDSPQAQLQSGDTELSGTSHGGLGFPSPHSQEFSYSCPVDSENDSLPATQPGGPVNIRRWWSKRARQPLGPSDVGQ